MDPIRTLAPALLACCTAIFALTASAQTESAVGKRQKVDARAMAPGPQASDAPADPAPPAKGLTRDQRKEATLQARQDGALRPAGEAADARDAGSAPRAVADSAPLPPPPGAPAEAVADASPPTQVAAATSPPVKKSKSRKTRPPAASAPAPA